MAPLREANPDDDFDLLEVMVPMRDGVTLRTLILALKVRPQPQPVLLLRTPYDANRYLRFKQRTSLHSVMGPGFAELQGYIFVFQDVRGSHGSGGMFELFRAPRGQFNATETDETTDAFDTVEWLVGNLPGNNGRVAIYGSSYCGWTTLMALLDPHPALKAAVPVSPLVDGWIGDDWFHHGAFRLPYAFEYIYLMESNTKSETQFPFSQYDTYTWWLNAPSPVELGRRYLDGKRHRFWNLLIDNPSYSAYWQSTAVDSLLRNSSAPIIPTLLVHGWFDQEDIYGAAAAYKALKSRDLSNRLVYLAAGPWFHNQNWGSSARTGAIAWNENAARRWRENDLAPFLAHYLKDGSEHKLAPVTVFNTGLHQWERLDSWPDPQGTLPRSLHLQPGGGLAWDVPSTAKGAAECYVSDPSRPIPYQPRPVPRILSDEVDPQAWKIWMTVDQRFVDGRPDVLTYVSDPFKGQLTLRGAVTAKLFAETTGTDADWVVKLIDVFPYLDPAEPEMSGYQLMISGDILRGRYRRQFERPEPIPAKEVLEYTIRLPHVNHTIRLGHRLMVHVQSTWFPLYDRNPQRFVPSIMDAKPDDYQIATHRIHTGVTYPSRIELSVHVGKGDGSTGLQRDTVQN